MIDFCDIILKQNICILKNIHISIMFYTYKFYVKYSMMNLAKGLYVKDLFGVPLQQSYAL